MSNRQSSLACATAIFLVNIYAQAADPLQANPASPWYVLDAESSWYFDLGVGAEYEPSYPGSDEYSAEPTVVGQALYRSESGHRYFLGLGEVGGIFALSPNTQFLAFLEYEEERDSGEDEVLRDLDAVDSTIEGQFMLAHRIGNASVYGVLQPDLTGDANKGLVWFVGASYDWLFANERCRLGTTFDISGADAEHMRTEFGVTEDEALRTGYAAYRPGAGVKSATWSLSAEYRFTPQLSVLSAIETEYYFNEAAESPLIDDFGRRIGIEASVLLRWRF